jgi:FMN-dependent NADH-azoreductase
MTILKIDSSITGENSVSRTLTARVMEQLVAVHGGEQVIERDLVSDPLDHLTLGAFANTSVLDEFLAADIIVIGAPMYNFTLPSQLKAWLDRILVAGKTFRYTEHGPEGLAGGKRVIIALSRGGFYGENSPAAGLEHLETYLAGVFGFIGIVPQFVHADGIAVGPEAREAGIAKGLQEIERLAA